MSGMVLSMKKDRTTVVSKLWRRHCKAAFPDRLRSVEIADIDMVMLDADVAGCICTWLDHGGSIDGRRRDVLAACERQLARVVPELSGYEAEYYERLLDMTVLILDVPRDPAR